MKHKTLGKGRHTRRLFHFGSRLPSVLKSMMGGEKALVVEEDAYIFYPYIEAVYRCPLFGERFSMTIQTLCCQDTSKVSASHKRLLNKTRNIRDVQKKGTKIIDVLSDPKTSEGSLYNNVYVKAEDPREYGLKSDWKRKMVVMKLVWIHVSIPLIGSMLQNRALLSSGDIYHRLHRRSYCWYFGENGWKTFSDEDVRALENKLTKKIPSKL